MKNELAVSPAILYLACLYYASILRSKALDTLGIQPDGCGFVCNKGLINIRNLVTQWWLFLFVCQYSTLQYAIYIKIHLIYIICIIFQYLVCALRWYQSGRLHNQKRGGIPMKMKKLFSILLITASLMNQIHN